MCLRKCPGAADLGAPHPVKVAAILRGPGRPRYTQSPAQRVPLPLYPALHAQLKLPTVLVQLALALQLCMPATHSLTSAEIQGW